MILLSFCSFPWWLSWLLPFLLGLALGWALWAKYKSMVADLEGKVASLDGRIKGLNNDVSDRDSRIADLQGDVSIAKGKMREAEQALDECLKSKAKGGSSAEASAIANVASFAAGATTKSSKTEDTNSAGSAGGKGVYAGLSNENLQIIEGIGPKMESVLKENGVNSWSDLASKDEIALRGILDNYGDKYKIIDVKTWQAQAQLAADRNFDGLIAMQKSIDGGSDKTLSESDSKLEKYLISAGKIKKYALDDLKAIEGIGPKIESLLNDAGVNTWRELSETSVDKLKEILENAGSRYKLADPGTWPQQAGLAADGKWDELQALQDELYGGR